MPRTARYLYLAILALTLPTLAQTPAQLPANGPWNNDLVVARSKDTPPSQWILGRGWDQNRWGDTRFPTPCCRP